MSRTALFARLRRAFALARLADQRQIPAAELIAAHHAARLSRRQFLKGSAATLGGLALARSLPGCRSLPFAPTSVDVAIVGAGMAGLHAAYRLQQAGIRATVYEAGERVGGRMYTARDIMAPGLTTELGGEFIDTGHEDMRTLATEFGFELLDMQTDTDVAPAVYHFNGRTYSEAEVVAAFQAILPRLQEDFDSTGEIVDFENEGDATALDNTPLAEYLHDVGAAGFLYDLLDVAYLTEYGLEIDQQSALNFLFLIGLEPDVFAVFGDSDERFKVRGGNQQLVDELARRVNGQVVLDRRLEALRARGPGYALTFRCGCGAVREVRADVVLLALPFTLLRQVDLQLELPDFKRRAINELGYGTNAKLMLGFQQRVWRAQGSAGSVFTDLPFQLAWDNSQLQPGDAGGLTLYSGGNAGLAVGNGTPASQAALLLPGVEQVFPGATAAHNGRVERFHWPTFPWTLGSYACYKPGQWTTIAGAEIRPVGNLFFAGEHCSYDFQGYMNGAAETGRVAAEEIAAVVGVGAALAG